MPGKERKLKIVPKYFPRRWKDVVFPEIRLAGKWLQDLGFKCGNFVLITQGESSITITVLPEVKEEPKPVKKNAHKAKIVISPDIDLLPGDQLFRLLSADEFNAYIEKVKEQKRRRKKTSSARAWEDFKKERLAGKSNTQTSLATKEAGQHANVQLDGLHPGQAAEDCDFDLLLKES